MAFPRFQVSNTGTVARFEWPVQFEALSSSVAALRGAGRPRSLVHLCFSNSVHFLFIVYPLYSLMFEKVNHWCVRLQVGVGSFPESFGVGYEWESTLVMLEYFGLKHISELPGVQYLGRSLEKSLLQREGPWSRLFGGG